MCQNSELRYTRYLLQLMFILVQQYLILFTLERLINYGQTVLLSSLVLSLYITVSVYVNYMNKCCLKREGNSLLKQNKDLEYNMKYYYIISPQKYKMLILFSPAV